jgi:hypothetical protein
MTTDVQQFSEKKRKVIFSYMRMLLCGIGIVFLAILIAHILNIFYPLPYIYVKICEYSGYACWVSSLGMRGWDIQTWNGNTPPEQLNKNLAKLFSITGAFAFVFARELHPLL